MADPGGGPAGMSPLRERGWKEVKEPKPDPKLAKDEKKLKKEEFKEHKRSLSRDHSHHKRSQSRDERKLVHESLDLGGDPAAVDSLHLSSGNAGHQRLGPLEKLQLKFADVIKGHHTVTNFRGEYTGKVDKDTGRFHGKGTLVTAAGDRYVGEWKDGELDGFGQYYGKDEVYEGNWKNGKIDGVGKFKWANGDEYEGTWRDSKAEGRGVYVWKNGDRYDGEWKDNRKWGRGKKTFSSGDEYTGEWKADRPHGTGVYTWQGNGRYEGEFFDGKKHGRGWRQWTTTRDEYSGDWKSDEISGHGTMTYGTGDVYEGFWRDGKRNGVGTQSRRNGDRYKGDWEDDRRHGLGRENFGNGDKYEGNYRCDKPEGFGIYVVSRGDRYEGEWRSGKRHGRGVMQTTGGDRYEGEWIAGERHGNGLLTSAVTESSGEVGPLEVEFRDDQNFVRKQVSDEKVRAREAAVEANKAAEEARRAAESARSVGEEKIASSIAIEWTELELDKAPLGEGSYGVVFKGKFRGLTVAVKILKLNQSKAINVKLEEEFLKEVKMLAELRHPNIILFMGAATKPQFCFITEFMPRGNLFEYLANRTVAIDEAMRLKMIKDITLGMVYLHQRKPPIIHKDLKSLNILVDEQIRLKICDFGLSQVKAAFGDAKNNVIGTPQWCAPELLRNEPYDEKVDVYSFGVVLWEMVTRSGPYPNMAPDQVRHEVLTNHLRPIIPSSCPVSLRRLMEFCWSEKPDARPAFTAIIEYLSQYQAQGAALADQQQQQMTYAQVQPRVVAAPAASAAAPQPVYLMPAPQPVSQAFPASFFPAQPQAQPVVASAPAAAAAAAAAPYRPAPPLSPQPQPMHMHAPVYPQGVPSQTSLAPAYPQGIPSQTSLAPAYPQGVPSQTSLAPAYPQGVPSQTSLAPAVPMYNGGGAPAQMNNGYGDAQAVQAVAAQQSAPPPYQHYMNAPAQPFQIQPLLPPTRQSSSPQPPSVLQYTGDPFAAANVPPQPPAYAYGQPAPYAQHQFAAFPQPQAHGQAPQPYQMNGARP